MRAAIRDEIYWGRPVPGVGHPRARLLIVGLAPAAHGANRTGRVFSEGMFDAVFQIPRGLLDRQEAGRGKPSAAGGRPR